MTAGGERRRAVQRLPEIRDAFVVADGRGAGDLVLEQQQTPHRATRRGAFARSLAAAELLSEPVLDVAQGTRDNFWRQGRESGHRNAIECIAAFSATDFRADLEKVDVPMLVIHGDDDQVVRSTSAARHPPRSSSTPS